MAGFAQPKAEIPPWLALLTACNVLGLLLFTSGFFLTRYELRHTSSPCTSGGEASGTHTDPEPACSGPLYRHVIVVLVDGLRYDFMAPSQLPSSAEELGDDLTWTEPVGETACDLTRCLADTIDRRKPER